MEDIFITKVSKVMFQKGSFFKVNKLIPPKPKTFDRHNVFQSYLE